MVRYFINLRANKEIKPYRASADCYFLLARLVYNERNGSKVSVMMNPNTTPLLAQGLLNLGATTRRLAGRGAAIASVVALSACASQPAEQSALGTAVGQDAPAASEQSADNTKLKPFDLQSLYSLLVADIAAQRKLYDITLRNYLRQAQQTRDPGLARQATVYAELLRAEAIALKASQIWAEAAPNSAEAQLSAGIHSARAREMSAALSHMERAMVLGAKTQFVQIAAQGTELTHSRKQALLARLEEISAAAPGNADLHYSVAQMAQNLEQNEKALARVEQGLALDAGNIDGQVLKAQTLEALGQREAAEQSLADAVKATPDNKRLRLQYARALSRGDMKASEQEFEELAARFPDDRELKFTLALVYRENERLSEAEALLRGLSEEQPKNNSVRYYLGLVLEDQGMDSEALAQFEQVSGDRFLLPALVMQASIIRQLEDMSAASAMLRAAALAHPEQNAKIELLHSNVLIDEGELEQALGVLNDALKAHSGNQDLLYARSMLSEKLGDLDGMERDLRSLLDQEPENATALNALGYSLTVHTARYDEALELIQRAHELKPNDPAIIDSMGWVHFRLGNLDLALQFLRQAHELFPDPEVAAHFGEALWTAGKQDEARSIWRAALDADPENRYMLDIIERFGQP